MTLKEAVAAYSLAYGENMHDNRWADGERAFIEDLLVQLKDWYYGLNPGDILSCARDPVHIAGYESMRFKEGKAPFTDGEDWPEVQPTRKLEKFEHPGPKAHQAITAPLTLPRRKRNANRPV